LVWHCAHLQVPRGVAAAANKGCDTQAPPAPSSEPPPLLQAPLLPASLIRFQLAAMGHLLERPASGEYDARVGFGYPDPWQRRLLDAVDQGEFRGAQA
jgi:hypothetical protein